MSKNWKMDDMHDKFLIEVSKKYRMKPEDLLMEQVRALYTNSNGGRRKVVR